TRQFLQKKKTGMGTGTGTKRAPLLLDDACTMDTNSLILVAVRALLLGSSITGRRGRRTRTGASATARLVESPKDSVAPPSVPGALKIAAVDSTRSIARADIASVTIHWREGENCYVTLNLQSGEKLTGLVACTDLDSIH